VIAVSAAGVLWLVVLAQVGVPAARPPTPAAADRDQVGSTALVLSTGFYTRAASDPARRTVVTERLHLESADYDDVTLFVGLGWVLQRDSAPSTALTLHGPANTIVGARYWISPPAAPHLRADVGLGLVVDTSMAGGNRVFTEQAHAHALAMQGMQDAWQWALGRRGLFAPLRGTHQHRAGRYPAQAGVDGGATLFLPSGDQDRGAEAVLQLAAIYRLSLRPWLALGAGVGTVWMPSARPWSSQSALAGTATLSRGRWRVAAELVANIDEPYGFLGHGQRIVATHVHVGVGP
jgi:hypothetical protein